MQPDAFLFQIIILIFSVVIHEVTHGYVAQMLGDPTARLAGRLTLNPIKHIDPLGSVIIPGILLLSGSSFLIGWAKPVPYNPYNLSNQKWGEALVAGAGPAVNIFIALIFGLIIRFGTSFDVLSGAFIEIASFVVFINILLAIFNLIPVPPLDGSKVLASILPYHISQKYMGIQHMLARYGILGSFLFIFLFIYFLWKPFFTIVASIFRIITDHHLCELLSRICGF
ncbi:site-2 protease family protein [Patescibacteria group bacterium]|nr:site-2 protease family protein [Patescibacteria group bacterium]MCH8889089.1 site-2 protease family protein [Patescibacteria group bacterium]